MSNAIELLIDVTHAVKLGKPAFIAATVTLPDAASLQERPIVCFAKAGGGYSRGYFTCDLPGPAIGAQASWHAERGWIFVSVDPLGSGGSSQHASEKLGYTAVTTASFAAEHDILLRLANGVLAPGFPPVLQPVSIGIGQSMGGALTIVQQGRHHCYDGIATLGFSAVHSHPPQPPGGTLVVVPWIPRDCVGEAPDVVTNRGAVVAASDNDAQGGIWQALAWGFFYDDVPQDVVERDLSHFEHFMFGTSGEGRVPISPWLSGTTPPLISQSSLAPGAVAPEAAAVTVPVLCAMGVRDMVVDPAGEPRAFKSATSVDLFICPRMGHMHNFASTRALLWQRIENFGQWCAAVKAAG